MGNLLQSVKQNPVLWIWNLLSYDNFLVYPMTFFRVIHIQGFHFHIKNVIKLFSSRLSLNGHHALWTGGRCTTRLYKAALQRAKCRVFCAILVSKWV